MKIQLDTTNKTIKIEENVKISKLLEILKKILPNEWKDFTLETHTTITYWNEPYIIRTYPTYPKWWEQPWYSQNIVYYSSSKNADNQQNALGTYQSKEQYQLKAGTYNIEV